MNRGSKRKIERTHTTPRTPKINVSINEEATGGETNAELMIFAQLFRDWHTVMATGNKRYMQIRLWDSFDAAWSPYGALFVHIIKKRHMNPNADFITLSQHFSNQTNTI